MEQERINIILAELTALDPALKDHESGVRAMLTEFNATQPRVTIDPAFRTGLRARLMLLPVPVRSPFSSFMWYAFRLVPIGAVALLAFILTDRTPSYIPSQEPAPVYTSPINSNPPYEETSRTATAPQSAGNAEQDMFVETESTMTLKQATLPAPAPDIPLTVSPQREGVFVKIDSIRVSQPTFIAVIASYPSGDKVIGISPLLASGTTENIPVYLNTRIVAEGTYRVEAYQDNGDQRFVQGEDMLHTDMSGYPWSLPLVVSR